MYKIEDIIFEYSSEFFTKNDVENIFNNIDQIHDLYQLKEMDDMICLTKK